MKKLENIPADFFSIIIFAAAFAAIIIALIAPPLASVDLDFSLLTKKVGSVMPSVKLRFLGLIVFILTLIAAAGFWASIWWMTVDYNERIQNYKDEQRPPATGSEPVDDPVQCTVDYYEQKGYGDRVKFVSSEEKELILLRKPALKDAAHSSVWTQDAVLVYPDGNPTTFSVGVLFEDAAWHHRSVIFVQRKWLSRRLKIETVLKHSLLKELADKSDYILTFGLASNSGEGEDPAFNAQLAHARAFNLAVAAVRLGWQKPNRVKPFAFGYSLNPAVLEADQINQRPVIIVGAIGDRKITVRDIAWSTRFLISVKGAELGDYSFVKVGPFESGEVFEKSEYISDPSSVELEYIASENTVLPALSSSKAPCDAKQ